MPRSRLAWRADAMLERFPNILPIGAHLINPEPEPVPVVTFRALRIATGKLNIELTRHDPEMGAAEAELILMKASQRYLMGG